MRANHASSTLRLLSAFVFFLLATQLHAQYENGSLTGTIRDSSGAPIVGAAVKITNDDTASVSQTKTNGTGDYEVPSLRVGVYSIAARAPSFSDAVAQGITISVGNRQRLNVALSLLGEPRVLLLDEPTASLDPGQRRRVWEVVNALHGEGGAVCFATQNVEEIGEHADRVVVMQDGHVVFVGDASAFEAEGVFE